MLDIRKAVELVKLQKQYTALCEPTRMYFTYPFRIEYIFRWLFVWL